MVRVDQGVEFGECHPPHLGDLTVAEPERAVVRDHVATAAKCHIGIAIGALTELLQPGRHIVDLDAQFLAQLTPRRLEVGLTGGHHAAGGDVPTTRPQVLVLGASVHEQPTLRGQYGHRHRAVQQAAGAHLGACGHAHHSVVVVDEVDPLITRLLVRHDDDAYHLRMDLTTLREEAQDLLTETVQLRRTLHRWPEIGNDLPITKEHVLSALEGLPLHITEHATTSGIAAVLDGGKPGPTVLLRGDMDALPLQEDTDLDFESATDGQMHACGHDTHTAMLVGAAKLLSARRADIPGRVLFMFQPGEEGYAGAKFMLEEGLLDVSPRADGSDSPVTGAYALHITTNLPSGFVASRGNSIMASSDSISITVTGRGGHASQPHAALDPIPVACEIVQALQMMVTRQVDVFDPAVVTVARISAGTTTNIIPETAEILGTVRAVSERTRLKVKDAISRVAEGIAAAHGASVAVEYKDGYPVTVNNPGSADFALGVAGDIVGADATFRMPHPIMGAEDFSYVLDRIPGAMLFLGGTPHDKNPLTAPANHSNRVVFDEQAMVNGIAVYSGVALRHLTGA